MKYKFKNGGIAKLQNAGNIPAFQRAVSAVQSGDVKAVEQARKEAELLQQQQINQNYNRLHNLPDNYQFVPSNGGTITERTGPLYANKLEKYLDETASGQEMVRMADTAKKAAGIGLGAVGGGWLIKGLKTAPLLTSGEFLGGAAVGAVGKNIGRAMDDIYHTKNQILDFEDVLPFAGMISGAKATRKFLENNTLRGAIEGFNQGIDKSLPINLAETYIPVLEKDNILQIGPKQTRVVSEGTYPLYTGPKHSVTEVVNPDGTVNPRAALRIEREVADNIPGAYRMESRLENPEWHVNDPNTWAHTRNVAQSAWTVPTPKGLTKQDQMVAALGHDFGKMISGDGHAQSSAALIEQIFPDVTEQQLTAISEHMGAPKSILGKVTKQADILNGKPAITRFVGDNGKIRLRLPSHTVEKPRELVLDPQGNNKFRVHTRTWDGDHIPAEMSGEDKNTLFNALYEELPEGAEILFPESGPGNYATRGTVAGLQRLARDSRFKPTGNGVLQYVDKDGSIKTFEGTGFRKGSDDVLNSNKFASEVGLGDGDYSDTFIDDATTIAQSIMSPGKMSNEAISGINRMKSAFQSDWMKTRLRNLGYTEDEISSYINDRLAGLDVSKTSVAENLSAIRPLEARTNGSITIKPGVEVGYGQNYNGLGIEPFDQQFIQITKEGNVKDIMSHEVGGHGTENFDFSHDKSGNQLYSKTKLTNLGKSAAKNTGLGESYYLDPKEQRARFIVTAQDMYEQGLDPNSYTDFVDFIVKNQNAPISTNAGQTSRFYDIRTLWPAFSKAHSILPITVGVGLGGAVLSKQKQGGILKGQNGLEKVPIKKDKPKELIPVKGSRPQTTSLLPKESFIDKLRKRWAEMKNETKRPNAFGKFVITREGTKVVDDGGKLA